MMSEPRHAMIFECDEGDVWLNMVPAAEGDDDRSPAASRTYGPFCSVSEAREYADENFQNTGSVIPVYAMHQEVDDRVDIHCIIDRVEDILGYNACQLDGTGSEVRDCVRKDMLDDFKRELIYNLGVNQRIKNNGQD